MRKFIPVFMYVILVVNLGIAVYFILSPRDKVAPPRVRHAEQLAPVIVKEPDRETEMAAPAKEPEKITTAITVSAPVLTAEPEKNVVVKRRQSTSAAQPEVVPPDESDAVLLDSRPRNSKPSVKKIASEDNDNILEDKGAANGFNTGIKKDSIKTKH